MTSHRAQKWNARRAALFAVVAVQVAMIGAAPPLDALADQERPGAPVHVESPEDESCPAAHNHLFCQAVRSLSGSFAAPCADIHSRPAPTMVVRLPSAPERGPSGPAFLTDCVVPRGPPLV